MLIDVLVVGAGPAGGQCARVLAQKGYAVLLVEQQPNFEKNNFSSAGTILSVLKDFKLPESVVGSEWKCLNIVTSARHFKWVSEEVQGVVLDFAKLRAFLAQDMKQHEGVLLLNHKYICHEEHHDHLKVTLMNRGSKEMVEIATKILVDATGPKHSIINHMKEPEQPYSTAVGLEYFIRADPGCHPSDTLTFFLGDHWMPEGYGWVFPMQLGLYKVGVAVYLSDPSKKAPSLVPYLQQLIEEYLHLKHYELIDQHGGGVRYCLPQYEHGHRGRILAVGDAFSCINSLGGEGIRHGMHSANLAAAAIDKTLQNGQINLRSYRKAILRHFNRTWKRCDRYSKVGYRLRAEGRLDFVFACLQKLPLSVLVDVLFHYRFARIKRLLVKRFLKKIFSFRTTTQGDPC